MENDSSLHIARHSSTMPKDGYYWDREWSLYFESDALFRDRIKQEMMLRSVRLGDGSIQ